MASLSEPGTRASSPAPRPPVVPFALWDGGMSAFSSVILTFVFATYVASAVASEGAVGDEAIQAAKDHGSQVLTTWQSIGAVAIALLAPLLGNLADRGGARNTLLRISTLATVLTIALMPLVALDSDYLTLGAVLIALAVVFSELAGVFVNSVLPEISTPENRGRISGTAWAVGYWGSIVCLGLVLVLFVMPGTGLLGITGEGGWNYRAIPLFVALWILVGTLPLMLRAPRHSASAPGERWTPWQGYAHIARRVVRAFREEPVMLQYLMASAIYRDGLGAVFSIAGVLAANAYGFSTEQIIFFGIAANLVAGFGVFLGGRVDDRVGPRPVIIAGCLGIIVLGLVVLAFGTTLVFWIAGLAICLFVGPVQSASRNLLTRLSQPGRETENFGLYATTGRALGFLGTAAFAATVAISGDTRTGILGIVIVMALGLVAFLPIRLGAAGRAPVAS
ncbi:putative transporter [Brachybacterium faecium]|uniref:Major facilitator superfamily permease n=1 Tax=Brachybacterium faecium (strain ATCC 43885 / DSM 4810 / JCM 11609 / LMG 19847 / NBRC 14762 / NCIMB 9860 / 6-10) TaxID=446465 RepID=C7MG70_BRAFD|nr:MFS transporter [Brachybacterium faecium]ACU86303.1 major facilitator superfamily permease [Brachybacterium faecium DSM 4810]SLN04468.1 putative transporter [Brachybacterium faecium]